MAVKGPLSDTCYQAENEKALCLDMTPAELLHCLKETEAPLEYTIEGAPGYSLVPYFAINSEETFTCFPALK
jgi:hypothetical protein